MPSIKEYNVKLHRLHNTEKMTRTMKLVAMSKLYRAQENQRQAKLYAQRLKDLIARLATSVESAAHPLFTPYKQIDNIEILVISSDKGMCGSFNNTLNKRVAVWITQEKSKYQQIELRCCGKRSTIFLKKFANVIKDHKGVTAKPDFLTATTIGKELVDDFISGKYQEIYLAYNIYHSPLSQTPLFEKILPIEPKILLEGGTKIRSDYIFEPAQEELLNFLIPKYLFFRVYFALLENSAGEHGARMTAMESATKNASELIDRYTLYRNRARQAGITKELIEIVSGAEALK